MSRRERERAVRIAEYVDGLVVHRRTRESLNGPLTPEDREFRDLARLANELSEIKLIAPGGFADSLAEHLPDMARADARGACTPDGLWRGALRALRGRAGEWRIWRVPHVLQTAAAMAMAALVLGALVFHLTSTRTVSAAEILSRADSALTQLVGPGRVLYRRWNVVERSIAFPGAPPSVATRQIHEWLDGSDLLRVAGRNVNAAGDLRLAYARVREDGQDRARVYFAPGFSNEPRGLLSIEPSRREFQAALAAFPRPQQTALQTYLDRGYIYEPIIGERRFNRAMLEEGEGVLPRTMLSLDATDLVGDVQVYRVRMIDPVRVRFRWRSSGPPVVWLARLETVRSISRDTYLGVRAEETYDFEDGRHIVTTRELVEAQVIDAFALRGRDDPFTLGAPAGVPVRRQSAVEHLSEVARALERVASVLSTTAGSRSSPAADQPSSAPPSLGHR